MTNQTKSTSVFELKGSMLTVPIIHLKTIDYKRFSENLQEMAAKTPKLFALSPVILDLAKVNEETIDFKRLCISIKSVGMVPVGFRNAKESHRNAAIAAGLGELSKASDKKQASRASKTKTVSPQPTERHEAPMIIKKPVRSGQQIYAKNSDLIIYGNVSSAAEVIADGNIMVHGVLGGRAIAGASGRKTAKILCQTLKADLISIAGQYKLRDEMEDQVVPKSQFGTQIYLDQQHLQIDKI